LISSINSRVGKPVTIVNLYYGNDIASCRSNGKKCTEPRIYSVMISNWGFIGILYFISRLLILSQYGWLVTTLHVILGIERCRNYLLLHNPTLVSKKGQLILTKRIKWKFGRMITGRGKVNWREIKLYKHKIPFRRKIESGDANGITATEYSPDNFTLNSIAVTGCRNPQQISRVLPSLRNILYEIL